MVAVEEEREWWWSVVPLERVDVTREGAVVGRSSGITAPDTLGSGRNGLDSAGTLGGG